MCKKESVIHVDSRHRNATSGNSNDITIDLDFPLYLHVGGTLQLKSLHLPNTLKTINTNINDKCLIGDDLKG